MYNKTKRILDLTGSILSIIGGSMIAFTCFLIFGSLAEYASVYSVAATAFSAVMFLFLALAVLLIIFGAILCKKPIRKEGVYQERKALNILLLVLLGIFTVLFLFSEGSILFVLLFGTALAFKITTFCLKSEIAEKSQPTEAVASTDEKIKELRRLKELGAISDEQYQAALDKIINNFHE